MKTILPKPTPINWNNLRLPGNKNENKNKQEESKSSTALITTTKASLPATSSAMAKEESQSPRLDRSKLPPELANLHFPGDTVGFPDSSYETVFSTTCGDKFPEDNATTKLKLHKSPKAKPGLFLYKPQREAARNLFTRLWIDNLRGALIPAGVGTGKTFVLGQFISDSIESGVIKGKHLCPYSVFYVTKASIVEQTRRVLTNWFGLDMKRDVLLTNYDQLRASFGEMYIDWKTVIRYGQEEDEIKWKLFHPVLFILDECQAVKNEKSMQSKVFQAACDIGHPLLRFVFASATPFTKVSEAKVVSVGCGVEMNVEEVASYKQE
jgi:hypothetical protein